MLRQLISSVGFSTPTKEPPLPLSDLETEGFDPSRCKVVALPEEIRLGRGTNRAAFAIVIENVLSPEECQRWIEETEVRGYEQALVNVGGGRQRLMTDVRNGYRCIVDDEARAKDIWERVRHFIPSDMEYENQFIKGTPQYLNERLRFLRYDRGQYFAPHSDGSFYYPDGHPLHPDVSTITLQLYLNEDFEGGTTRFFCGKEQYDVVPKTGSVLLFEHHLLHSGEAVASGRKYALRTDVMTSEVDRSHL